MSSSSTVTVYNCKLLWQHCEVQSRGIFFFFFSERPSESIQSGVTNTGGLPGNTEGCLWPLLVGT